MKPSGIKDRGSPAGFTLHEMAISMLIITMVIAGAWNVFTLFQRSYNETTLMRTAAARGSRGLELMIYGVGTNAGLREASTNNVSITTNAASWKITYMGTNLFFQYTTNTQSIVDQSGKTICTNLISSRLVPSVPRTSVTNGCTIALTVVEQGGGRVDTNAMSTFVQFRN